MKIKEFAIIGINKGNGHPYSFSAITNGCNYETLSKYCEYDTIKQYLKNIKLPKKKFSKFKINYIYTQNFQKSKKISKSCKIKYILKSINNLPKNISGVILARDDFKFNNNIISKCLNNKISIFLDKQISKDLLFLKRNKNKILTFGKIYGGSGLSYCDEFLKFKKYLKKNKIKIYKVVCTSKGKWMNYGQHLLDPLYDILKFKKLDFSCEEKNKNTKILVSQLSGINCKFILKEKNYNDIKFVFYTNKGKKSIKFSNPYNAFSRMLMNYYKNYNNDNKKGIEKLYIISENILNGQKIINKNGN